MYYIETVRSVSLGESRQVCQRDRFHLSSFHLLESCCFAYSKAMQLKTVFPAKIFSPTQIEQPAHSLWNARQCEGVWVNFFYGFV